MVALVVILALFLGGGVSFAAENALPGDALYVVKTEVNENVRAALAVSAEADARWHANVAERRLKEAEALSARGELSGDVAAELGAKFNQHAEAALKGASELAADGNADASADIAAELESFVSFYADLFTRESSSGAASERAFVLPHVLEKSGASVRVGDINADGSADVTVKSGTQSSSSMNAEASGGSSAEAESNTRIDGYLKLEVR